MNLWTLRHRCVTFKFQDVSVPTFKILFNQQLLDAVVAVVAIVVIVTVVAVLVLVVLVALVTVVAVMTQWL